MKPDHFLLLFKNIDFFDNLKRLISLANAAQLGASTSKACTGPLRSGCDLTLLQKMTANGHLKCAISENKKLAEGF